MRNGGNSVIWPAAVVTSIPYMGKLWVHRGGIDGEGIGPVRDVKQLEVAAAIGLGVFATQRESDSCQRRPIEQRELPHHGSASAGLHVEYEGCGSGDWPGI